MIASPEHKNSGWPRKSLTAHVGRSSKNSLDGKSPSRFGTANWATLHLYSWMKGKGKRKREKLRICPSLKEANFSTTDPHTSHDPGIKSNALTVYDFIWSEMSWQIQDRERASWSHHHGAWLQWSPRYETGTPVIAFSLLCPFASLYDFFFPYLSFFLPSV